MGPVSVYRKEVPATQSGDTEIAGLPQSPQRLAIATGPGGSEYWWWRTVPDIVAADSAGTIVLPRQRWRRALGAEVERAAPAELIGKVVGADVIPPGPGLVFDVSPTVNIRPAEGYPKPVDSWWDIRKFVAPKRITEDLRIVALTGGAPADALEVEVITPVHYDTCPTPYVPGWQSKLFVVSLKQPLDEAYGGAPIVLLDDDTQLVGITLCAGPAELSPTGFAAWCYPMGHGDFTEEVEA